MSLEKAVSVALKEYRINNNLSQEELANMCNLDRTYISLLETCKRKPTLNVIFNICEHLNVKPSVFISYIEVLMDK
ncbi:helix-turn-helix domain-containing protein [Clostridium beijerinckii]|jgi:Predicted transcriptional regulators|uniref:helix-turn-helix domain-containing protein n=1 Tax=Clostridium beijerinckii TaxID=1520 RepID=UPI00098C98C6|nr:helix-turn-helix transcriptional regulator [Clostridium beijerinckii]NRT77863.1 transcriptional regulator with XRE-family HTH domain [Clostridium beijerinckii]OOM42315.1 helix-turn-helix domain protein [Clostridium beijerinckii]